MRNIGMIFGNVKNYFSSFLRLLDTPSSYVGHGEKVVKVKADVSGLEFAEEYMWNLEKQGLLSEVTNLQVTASGTGEPVETIPEGDFFAISAYNENGETLAVPNPPVDVYADTPMEPEPGFFTATWDSVEGAVGYYIYMYTGPENGWGRWAVDGTSVDFYDMIMQEPETGIEIPIENTAESIIPLAVENGDMVRIVGEGIDVDVDVDEEDGTIKEITLTKKQNDWEEEDEDSPNFIKNKPEIPTNTDEKVKYDAEDTEAGYLADKIIAGENVTIEEGTGDDTNKVKISAAGAKVFDLIGGVKDGRMYNQYALLDERDILPEGWHIPTITELSDLLTYATNNGGVEGLFSEASGGTNSLKFNLTLAGRRSTNISGRTDEGVFVGKNSNIYLWSCSSDVNGTLEKFISLTYNATSVWKAINGNYVRPVKDATFLQEGEEGIFTGNDGRVYKTICIDGNEWLAENLSETKYRTGDSIPEITDNYEWAALTTGARCSYDNYENNAVIPAQLEHNNLPGLQGGSATERYHLTLEEKEKIQTIPEILNLVRTSGGTASGSELASGVQIFGLIPDELLIHWCQISWALLDAVENGTREDGGIIDIIIDFTDEGAAYFVIANEITFTSSRISGITITIDSDPWVVTELTFNVTFVGDTNPFKFIYSSRFDPEPPSLGL